MYGPHTHLASRPSLWAPFSPLFFDDDETATAGSQPPEPAGGATTTTETSPATPDHAPASSGGTSEQPSGFDTPFRLEDVPEGIREHVARYNAQLQGAFTKKTMELAEQRKTLDPHLSLVQALDSDDEDTRDNAIRELLAKNGWDVGDDEEAEEALAEAAAAGVPGAAAAQKEGETSPPPPPATDPESQRRIEALEQAEQERQVRAYEASVRDRVSEGLDAYRKQLGLAEDKSVPEHLRDLVMTQAKALGPDDNGLPRMAEAVELVEGYRQAELTRYAQSKDTPGLDLSGPTTTEQKFDPRDPVQRLAAANAIAARHVS